MSTLGSCSSVDNDTLVTTGSPTASWMSDGSGGGTLSVSVPKWSGCNTPPGTDSQLSYSAILTLTRGDACKKRTFKFEVSGKGNGYFGAGTNISITNTADLILNVGSPGGDTSCAAAKTLKLRGGANPAEADVSCGDVFTIVTSGYRTGSQAFSYTITMTDVTP